MMLGKRKVLMGSYKWNKINNGKIAADVQQN